MEHWIITIYIEILQKKFHVYNALNSTQINKLGNWRPKDLPGAESICQRGGIHGNPGRGNHPQKQPLTGTVTLNESVETTYPTQRYIEIGNQEGGKGRGKNLQRFVKIQCK